MGPAEGMSIRRMMLLVAVARTGSISGAARSLHQTPSAISQQIAVLETEIGHDLLQRTAKGVILTDAGRVVVRHAERIERIHEAAHREVRALEDLRSGTLRLGTFPTFSQSLLPRVLEAFRAKAPDVEIEIESGTREDLRLRLESGEVEIAFLWDYASSPLVPTADEELALLAEDPIVLLAPEGDPLPQGDVTLEDLAGSERWITREGHASSELLERTLGGRSPARAPQRTRTYGELQALVGAGLGRAVVPRSAVTAVRGGLTTRIVADAEPRRLLFAFRRHGRMAPAAGAMNGVLRSLVASDLD